MGGGMDAPVENYQIQDYSTLLLALEHSQLLG